jgi:hypothetical protein
VIRNQLDSHSGDPENVQVGRAEYLQELLRAGIEMHEANKIRGWLERHMGVPLLDTDKLATKHIGTLGLLEHNIRGIHAVIDAVAF